MKKVVVVGSLNMDLVLKVDRMPKIGETIQGENINYLIGGKGANQAVTCSRLGNDVSIIGTVGKDTFGDKLISHLELENINITTVRRDECSFTGIATIFKTPKDNSIVVIPGANEFSDIDLVERYRDIIKNADIIISQLEIPMETVKRALEIAREYGVKSILNPAPAKKIDEELLKNVDYITPNETEFEILTGKSFEDNDSIVEEMLDWQKSHNTRLIVTRGSEGVAFVEENEVISIPCSKVDKVVDTTGAGDTFNGALAHGLVNGFSIKDAIIFANKAAGLSVTKFGAQTGIPYLKEVENIL